MAQIRVQFARELAQDLGQLHTPPSDCICIGQASAAVSAAGAWSLGRFGTVGNDSNDRMAHILSSRWEDDAGGRAS